jgi:hypothetical protein
MLAEWVRRPRLCLASTVPGGLGSPSAPTTGGCPQGLDGTGRAGRKLRDRAGGEPAVRVPEVRSRSPKSPRWSAARRCALRKGRGRRPATAHSVSYGGFRSAEARSAEAERRRLKRQRLAALRPLTSGARTEGAPGALKHSRAAICRAWNSAMTRVSSRPRYADGGNPAARHFSLTLAVANRFGAAGESGALRRVGVSA